MKSEVSSAEVLQRRGTRHPVDTAKPYAVVQEQEACGDGPPAAVTTVFLTASECPLHCVMCDLWKNTLSFPTPLGMIPQQIRQALKGRPRRGWLKLYNSGSFFDRRSIPEADYSEIAALCKGFERVIVENHPRVGARQISRFAEMLDGRLEIAVGLESVQPGMLRRLNKQMTRSDFDGFATRLRSLGIDLRVFLMLRPPWTDAAEAVRWTVLSVKHAIAYGARHISIIPARDGNGWMDDARRQGIFTPPSTDSLEQTLTQSLECARRFSAASLADEYSALPLFAAGRGDREQAMPLHKPHVRKRPQPIVTVDLWDWDQLASCAHCSRRRRERLEAMNLRQSPLPAIDCQICATRNR